MEVHADQQARSPRAGHRNRCFDQTCYLNLSLSFLKINLESKSAKCVPSLSPPRISCQDGSCLQAIIARWGVSVSNWCFQMGHSYVEKPCNYGVYTLIIFSTFFCCNLEIHTSQLRNASNTLYCMISQIGHVGY